MYDVKESIEELGKGVADLELCRIGLEEMEDSDFFDVLTGCDSVVSLEHSKVDTSNKKIWEKFCAALASLPNLEKLSFYQVSPLDLRELERSFRGHKKKLRSLNVEACHLGEIIGRSVGGEGYAEALAAMIKSASLKELKVTGNHMHDKDITTIADALKESKLEVLKLGYNDIGDDAARILGRVLKDCPGLRELDLSGNKIKAQGVIALLRAIDNQRDPGCSLESLALEGNDLDGRDDVKRMIEKLKGKMPELVITLEEE